MPKNTVSLQIDGIDWQGWFSCQVTRSIEAIAGGFSLGLTNKWEEKQKRLPIACGMSAKILLDNEEIINGYIDTVSHSFDAKSHSISVSGRDKCADLVDCSAVHNPSQFINLNVLDIANELSKPFGVSPSSSAVLGAVFPNFKLETGEKAFDALVRALKQRELLAVPNRQGDFVLTKLGDERMESGIVQGENVLSAQLSMDAKERYSCYICHGQQQGNDDVFGKACSTKGQVKDSEIERYKPIIVRASQQGNADFMKKRAEWECKVNRAKSVSLSVKVQGFRGDSGELWDIGKTVFVKLPFLGIEQDLLIVSTTFSKSLSGGSITDLSLKDLDAYAPEPVESSASASGASGGGNLSLYVQQAQSAKAENQRISKGKV